ncbi:glycosyltransferase 25 family member [Glossina fuscipes]|uniref:Glycosyltransferase 25 family member n=1 Tax=Glossina fuscipes TaxID=7396 RepID=A0A8U0W8L9_9MUSC|nr:glycosyltransferase 25 family member [Glossina fuscipes]KAI9587920.1 hypothetical protein GQX74_003766 [Glossina fuscipes]
MIKAAYILLLFGIFYQVNLNFGDSLEDVKQLLPNDLFEIPSSIMVVILVRNKAHVLPIFLTYFEQLDYPKERIALWIRSDHNFDNSIEILEAWLQVVQSEYHSVNVEFDNTKHQHENESSSFDWPRTRFEHVIKLKEEALKYALKIWADYIFYLDADVLLTSPATLRNLVNLKLPLVAPMLLSESLYSNFWCGMSSTYYYIRTDDYIKIYNVKEEGIFKVMMIHSAVLVDLNYRGAQYLTFDREQFRRQQKIDLHWSSTLGPLCRRPYEGPLDDIIVFAMSANCSKIPLFVTNELPFGYILQPLDSSDSLSQDLKQLINIKTNIIHDFEEIKEVDDYLKKYEPRVEKDTMSLDHIYLINLERRPERRKKMLKLFEILGLEVEYFPAIDGKKLDHNKIQEMNIKFMPGYEDPYHHRPMTMGEIGCFLSHYYIWQNIVEKKLDEVLILEDDIRFEPYFKENAEKIITQARSLKEYDLIYFGRKRLKDESEPPVKGTDNLLHVGYSYWTLGYVLTLKGAKKLIDAQPLQNLLPVDEFLPIMFDRHPVKNWSSVYPKRDLIAYSSTPLLLYPSHYTGDVGYISDTEDSVLLSNEPSSNYTQFNQAQLKSDRELDFMQIKHESTQSHVKSSSKDEL